MDWSDFSNKKVGLLGAGIENIALISHLLKAGAAVTVCNSEKTDRTDSLEGQDVEVVIGEKYLQNLDRFDFVFRIAGMPIPTLNKALELLTKKPTVNSPTNLFLELKPCHIIGVTGTKGKGTTSTLIGSILEAAGKEVFVVGNIGRAMFDIYDELGESAYVVVELSSFQLEDVTTSPEIAVILPVTEDHLQPVSTVNPNFHPTVSHYQAAKANITAFQNSTDLLVYDADSEPAAQIARESSARQIGVGTRKADLVVSPTGEIRADGNVLLDLKQMGLSGEHIFLDATIAVAVAREIGCDSDSIMHGLRNFRPLPHRMETFTAINGVTFVDDSYATNPTATMAALTAFTQPIILIIGGASIGADFKELAEKVASSTVKATVLIGQEAARLKQSLESVRFSGDTFIATSFNEAVDKAIEASVDGDVVLLSPACKSFDMFKNASDRGEQFKSLVMARSVAQNTKFETVSDGQSPNV